MPDSAKNRLRGETSPYLRQHAGNPVDWYPWGDEAFARARAEDRPVLLSIGYSACHWCHVMAHESFEDAETAALMNREYINIKVDREEHPDVDQIYQHALQVFGEHGGWPLTMFLLPSGEPFFGGTYFPPRDNFGRPSFRRVLSAMAEAYRDKRGAVVEQGRRVVEALCRMEARAAGEEDGGRLPNDYVERAASKLALRMDRRHGGFEGRPKFPNPSALEVQLRAFARCEEGEVVQPVLLTLTKMAQGGIYDHLGGGFARYSTDEHWLVPHFEKMLYDNAQLLRLYALGVQLAVAAGLDDHARRYEQVIRETHGWLEREMRHPEGGLYAAQDADSEGVEGKYFVWTPREVEEVLAPDEAALLMRCYDVREGGNWHDPHGHAPEGTSILHLVSAPRDDEEGRMLARAKEKLFAHRSKRVPPGTDDKILTGWNGLAISGLAEAGLLLGDAAMVESARRTAHFLLARLIDKDGALLRTYKEGVARLPGTLDDHAFLAEGLYNLARGTMDLSYLSVARRLMDRVLDSMYDTATRTFYLAPPQEAGAGVPMVARPTSLHDSAIPSGMSVACMNLLRLAALLPVEQGQRYREVAEQALLSHASLALRAPFGMANLCAAVDLLQHGLTVTVISFPEGKDEEGRRLRDVADTILVPDHFVLLAEEGRAQAGWEHLVSGRGAVSGRATAYVCQGSSCSRPVTSEEELGELLRAAARQRSG